MQQQPLVQGQGISNNEDQQLRTMLLLLYCRGKTHPELASLDMARATASWTKRSASSRVKSSLQRDGIKPRVLAIKPQFERLGNRRTGQDTCVTSDDMPHLYSESQ